MSLNESQIAEICQKTKQDILFNPEDVTLIPGFWMKALDMLEAKLIAESKK